MDGHTFLGIQNLLDQVQRIRHGQHDYSAAPRTASNRYPLKTEPLDHADNTIDDSEREYTLDSGGEDGRSVFSTPPSARSSRTTVSAAPSWASRASTTQSSSVVVSSSTHDSRGSRTSANTTIPSVAPQQIFAQQFTTDAVAAAVTADVTAAVTAVGSPQLWCELSALTRCDATFAANDTRDWVDHHVAHLSGARGELPLRCTCWFCDDHESFHAPSQAGAWERLVARMDHIREHIVHDGMRPANMRPDFFVVDHLWAIGRLDAATYRAAKAYTELPSHLRWPGRHDDGDALAAAHAPVLDASSELEVIDLARQERERRRRPPNRRARPGNEDGDPSSSRRQRA